MTYQFNAPAVALSVFAVDAAITSLANNRAGISAAFKDVTFETYEDRRKAVIAALVDSGKTANEKAGEKMFQRVMDELEITKPKSAKKAATAKADQRAKAKEASTNAVKEWTGSEVPGMDECTKAVDSIKTEWHKAQKAGDLKKAEELLKAQNAVHAALIAAQKTESQKMLLAEKDEKAKLQGDIKAWMRAAQLSDLRKVIECIREIQTAMLERVAR